MRNSTVDMERQARKPRRKGPIRTEAVIPFLIIVALTWLYFHFLFDGHLRRGMEYAATQGVGAEVNVGAVETSFWDASLVVRDIQVTDSDVPARNLIQIGTVSFSALWDGLLRGKVVIDRADILDIQALSPRKSPGRVLPVDPNEVSMTDKLLGGIRKQFDGNVLGDLAAMAAGADPGAQLGKLGDDLKASARVAQLQNDLAQKEQEWKARIAALPKSEELQALQQRLGKVKLDRFKDVLEVQASLKELEAIRNDVNAKVKNVQGTGQAVGTDLNGLKSAYAELDRAVKQDVADLQAHFRIPTLDAHTLANMLFGPELFAKVSDARGYMDKARAYMPPKRTAEEKAALRLQPHERGEGRNYAFGRPRAYPRFWLKRATISSKSGSGPYSGDLSGEIRDVTDDPPLVGRPMIFTMQGDFPGQQIYGTRFELMVDHTTAAPVERLAAEVGRFGISGRELVHGDKVSLGFDKADGRFGFNAELRGDKVDLRLAQAFTNVGYQVQAQSAVAREIIEGALGGVPAVNVNGRVSGTWDHLNWYLATNLGEELEKGFRRQLQAKVDQARARIEAQVNERIAAERNKLQARYAAAEKDVMAQLAAKQAEVDKLKAEFDKSKAQFEQQKSKLLKTQEQKLKDEANKLLKGLPKGT